MGGGDKSLYAPIQSSQFGVNPDFEDILVEMQNGNNTQMPGAKGTTIQVAGCGPLSAYNLLVELGKIEPSQESLSKILGDYSPYWNCKPGEPCFSAIDSVAAVLKKNGVQPGGLHTDTSVLASYTGMLTYGGKVTGPGANVPHLTTLKCESGNCCMLDSAFGGGVCNQCNIVDSSNLKCGEYNYHVGKDTGGNPDSLQEIIN